MINAGVFVILLTCEAAAFFYQAAHYVTPFYPPNWDQTSFLMASYRLVEAARAGDLWFAFWHQGVPPGLAFQLQGALLMLVFGANRVTALALNFLYFAALQIVVWRTVRWFVSDDLSAAANTSGATAWLAVAFLLLQHTTIFWAGGMYDYRLDFAAYCGYGMWCCAVLRSGVFEHRWWSIVAGLVAAALVSMRMLTVVYVGGIMGVLLIWFLVSGMRRRA